MKLNLPFVPVRKKNKLPWRTICVEYELEYGTDLLCIHEDAVEKGDRVAIIDDILATGGTAEAMCKMGEMAGAEIVCCAFFMELNALGGRSKLGGRNVVSILAK